MSQSSISEEVIDEETRNVTMYIGQKISDLHKGERPKSKYSENLNNKVITS